MEKGTGVYARYLRETETTRSSYQFEEQCSLFGCNEGFIPWLLRRRITTPHEDPYKWHLPIRDCLNGAKSNVVDYTGSTLIIDLKPKQNKDNLSLYEILDVWGYSEGVWSTILLHLSGLFVDASPKGINRKKFDIEDCKRDEPIYEFMYLDGGVRDGKLVGRWNAPPVSATNAALLWPKPLHYFLTCIRNRTPDVVSDILIT